jgi:hypothetical protein
MGDHVPDFIMRSFAIAESTGSDNDDDAPQEPSSES